MEENKIFTKEFQNVDYQTISNEIKSNGFFSFENAMTEEFMDNITSDVKNTGLSLNTNNVVEYTTLTVINSFLPICWLFPRAFSTVVLEKEF